VKFTSVVDAFVVRPTLKQKPPSCRMTWIAASLKILDSEEWPLLTLEDVSAPWYQIALSTTNISMTDGPVFTYPVMRPLHAALQGMSTSDTPTQGYLEGSIVTFSVLTTDSSILGTQASSKDDLNTE
jgi:hypothetical protein